MNSTDGHIAKEQPGARPAALCAPGSSVLAAFLAWLRTLFAGFHDRMIRAHADLLLTRHVPVSDWRLRLVHLRTFEFAVADMIGQYTAALLAGLDPDSLPFEARDRSGDSLAVWHPPRTELAFRRRQEQASRLLAHASAYAARRLARIRREHGLAHPGPAAIRLLRLPSGFVEAMGCSALLPRTGEDVPKGQEGAGAKRRPASRQNSCPADSGRDPIHARARTPSARAPPRLPNPPKPPRRSRLRGRDHLHVRDLAHQTGAPHLSRLKRRPDSGWADRTTFAPSCCWRR